MTPRAAVDRELALAAVRAGQAPAARDDPGLAGRTTTASTPSRRCARSIGQPRHHPPGGRRARGRGPAAPSAGIRDRVLRPKIDESFSPLTSFSKQWAQSGRSLSVELVRFERASPARRRSPRCSASGRRDDGARGALSPCRRHAHRLGPALHPARLRRGHRAARVLEGVARRRARAQGRVRPRREPARGRPRRRGARRAARAAADRRGADPPPDLLRHRRPAGHGRRVGLSSRPGALHADRRRCAARAPGSPPKCAASARAPDPTAQRRPPFVTQPRKPAMRLHLHAKLALAPATLGLAATPAAAQAPVKIGSILSVTGPAAFLGEDMKAGMELAVEEINAKGGVARPQDRLDLLRRREPDAEGPDRDAAAARPGQGRHDRRRRQHERHGHRHARA